MRAMDGRDQAAAGQAAGASSGGREEPARSTGLGAVLQRLASWYAWLVNAVVFICGVLFVLQAYQSGILLHMQGAALTGCREAALLLFGNFALPFSEDAALAVSPTETASLPVWSFWVPGMLGSALVLTSTLGHLSLRLKRPACVLPYAFLAAIFLVWQVEVSKMLSQVAYGEDFTVSEEQSEVEQPELVQLLMFQTSYNAFAKVFADQGCRASPSPGPGHRLVRATCAGSGLEAKLMQVTVTEFCRARKPGDATTEFDRRVKACKTLGRKLRILPAELQPREDLYCRCRSATFDLLRLAARWIMAVWFAELFGVCAVLYLGAEPNLARMGATERREVLAFALVGIAILACKVTVFADSPLDSLVPTE